MPFWSPETLRLYVLANLDSLRRENDLRHDAADRAVAKAEQASDARFHSVNEFRAALSDQTATFMPRVEAIARADANAAKITELSARLDRLEGSSAGTQHTVALFLTLAALLLSLVGVIVAVLLAR